MKKTPKQVIKTKEEVIAQLRKNQDFVKKMKFTKEVHYPALCAATNSIEDATQFLSSITNIILEKGLQLMKEKKMIDIKLFDSLDSADPKHEELKTLVHLFDDISLYDAKELLEGMKMEINMFVTRENEKRLLKDLTTQWIDETTK